MVRSKEHIINQPETPFASMIDIVFLLLVFFVLQPFKQPELTLQADLPGPRPPVLHNDAARAPLLLRVISDPDDPQTALFVIDGIEIASSTPDAVETMVSVLVRLSDGQVGTPVHILAASHVHFRHILMALDACHKAQLSNVRFEKSVPREDAPDPSEDG